MLIFNGKKYFVPFISTGKVVGADATPDQVVEGVKFAGANGVVEEGRLPFYDGEDLPAAVYEHNNEYAYIQSNVNKTSIIEDVVYSKVPLSQFSCTLVFEVDDAMYGDLYVAYTKSDGTAHFDVLPPETDTTIEGIMCGSVIAMYSQDGSYFYDEVLTELGSLGPCNIYSAPIESGTYILEFDRS